MGLKKAIEITENLIETLPGSLSDEEQAALKLLIEAGKFIHENRGHGAGGIPSLLPGETEE